MFGAVVICCVVEAVMEPLQWPLRLPSGQAPLLKDRGVWGVELYEKKLTILNHRYRIINNTFAQICEGVFVYIFDRKSFRAFQFYCFLYAHRLFFRNRDYRKINGR